MNGRQRCAVMLGFVVILLIGLYPRWTITYVWKGEPVKLPMAQGGASVVGPPYAYSFEYGVGHKWLPQYARWWRLGEARWVEETDDEAEHYYRIDTSLLLVQWFLVSAVTGILVMFLGHR